MKGEQLPNYIKHHFSPQAQPTPDGQQSSQQHPGWPQLLPIHLVTPKSEDSTHASENGLWVGQLVGRSI